MESLAVVLALIGSGLGMPKKQPRLTSKERKAQALAQAGGVRSVDRHGTRMAVSGNVSDEAVDAAERYFAQKERHGGPAQQMMDFIEPLMEKARADGEEATNRIMSFGVIFWNLAIMNGEDREEALTKAEAALNGTDDDRTAFRNVALAMIARHEAMFPWLHRERRG
jgi:hypothetical protein